MIGVGKSWQRSLIASAVQKLGTQRSVVVHGNDGICEVSNADETTVSIVTPEKISEEIWSPHDFGLTPSTRDEIVVKDPGESALLIEKAISGDSSGARDIVVLNAATAIWLTDDSKTLKESAEQASEQIDSHNARKTLDQLIKLSQEEND